MAEKTTSQSQQSWRSLFDEHLARMSAMADELGRAEGKGLEQMAGAIDESARILKAGLAYAAQIHAEWRRLAVEGTRQAASLMSIG